MWFAENEEYLKKNIQNQSGKDIEKEYKTDKEDESKIVATTQGSRTRRCARTEKQTTFTFSIHSKCS